VPSDTRDRIVQATAELFRRQGYAATGLKQILGDARAPSASLYHFFPGGKEELGIEVIAVAGDFFQRLFETIAAQAPDALSAMHEFFAGAARTLEETDYADACPIATVALEVASTNDALRQATAAVFDSWVASGTHGLIAAGLPEERARRITVHMIAALEGAFVLSRAARSPEPLLIAGDALVAELAQALTEERAGARQPA